MRHSSLVRLDLESDGMPVLCSHVRPFTPPSQKVMAAFGALPAMIYVGPDERQDHHNVHGYRVVAGAVKQRLEDELRGVQL